MKAEWVYDSKEDILTLFIKGRTSAYSLASEDNIFTVDLDSRNRICALEVFDASKVIAGTTKKTLGAIRSAELQAQMKGGYLVAKFKLLSISAEPIQDSIPIAVEA